ncbi:unnamed protein product [Rhizoctonia solani]|uniref:lytic cellulose monooxygenase (C4-dehydrogenating) n=1 Tax=Rhizoctonia solani TaxID=456999 RepID=A0A8H3D7S7_9AGAM|nr:unnamed protein product [Rhizoctonia solani]
MLAKVAFALLSVASSVLAHGNLQEIVVDTPPATYIPWLPFQDPYKPTAPERVGRKIPDNGPIEDVTSIDIQCNKGAVPAALIATAAAGSKVALSVDLFLFTSPNLVLIPVFVSNWTDWPTSHIGPVITYLAKAPSDITQWSPGNDKVWFKIDEAGLDNGKWAATDVLLSQNGLWTVTIPQSLQPGQYLMRHEIIALHGAQNYPGAQFYPSCIQFEITGSGSALPNDSDLVSFPGAYSGTDPGVKYNPYAGATTYPIPGPPVWDGTGSGTGSGGSGGSGAVSSSAATPSSTVVASSTAVATSISVVSSTVVAPSSSAVASETASAPVETEASASTKAPAETDVPTSAAAATSTAVASSVAPVSSSAAASISTTAAASTPTGGAGGVAALYAQCGGANFNGPKGCVAPYTCKDWNPYYSQCVQA